LGGYIEIKGVSLATILLGFDTPNLFGHSTSALRNMSKWR